MTRSARNLRGKALRWKGDPSRLFPPVCRIKIHQAIRPRCTLEPVTVIDWKHRLILGPIYSIRSQFDTASCGRSARRLWPFEKALSQRPRVIRARCRQLYPVGRSLPRHQIPRWSTIPCVLLRPGTIWKLSLRTIGQYNPLFVHR